MKRLVILLMMSGTLVTIYPQQIYRTCLEGMGVQGQSFFQAVDGFTVFGPDIRGYVYLVAHAGADSGAVIRTKWQGSGFQPFLLPEGEHVTGFETSGPDIEGYVYLTALGSDGSSGEIVRTRWIGSGVQSYTVPEGEKIKTLGMEGPDVSGYVYLTVGTVGIEEDHGQGWTEPPTFGLDEISNPCTDKVEISFSVAKACHVQIKVYDTSGRLIATLADEKHDVGGHDLIWPVTDDRGYEVGAGVYFVKMVAGEFTATHKAIVVR